MSLTLPQSFRSPIAEKLPAQTDAGCEERHLTIIEMADAICEAVLGPTRYAEVDLLNRVSQRLSDEGMALACTDPLNAYMLMKIALELGEKAEKLDRELIAEMADFFDREAN